jgi:hypothetical protein
MKGKSDNKNIKIIKILLDNGTTKEICYELTNADAALDAISDCLSYFWSLERESREVKELKRKISRVLAYYQRK